MPKKKHQPPAKIKYDKTHPVVSIRVDQDLKNKLAEIKQISGKSTGDILREAVGVQGKSTKKAYRTGIEHAKIKYGVWYKCSGCGETILIQHETEKKAAGQCMREHGWGHADCKNR
ncbi:ribbon-helix-helix protein, CopG family [Chloroflexota bacterium]